MHADIRNYFVQGIVGDTFLLPAEADQEVAKLRSNLFTVIYFVL